MKIRQVIRTCCSLLEDVETALHGEFRNRHAQDPDLLYAFQICSNHTQYFGAHRWGDGEGNPNGVVAQVEFSSGILVDFLEDGRSRVSLSSDGCPGFSDSWDEGLAVVESAAQEMIKQAQPKAETSPIGAMAHA